MKVFVVKNTKTGEYFCPGGSTGNSPRVYPEESSARKAIRSGIHRSGNYVTDNLTNRYRWVRETDEEFQLRRSQWIVVPVELVELENVENAE